MCILYKYIYITSITFWAIFEHVSANTARLILWTHKILSCPAFYTIHIMLIFTYLRLISCSLLFYAVDDVRQLFDNEFNINKFI